MGNDRTSKADGKPVRRHLNRAERLALTAASVSLFTSQYGRKAQRGVEPNDRRYDRETEKAIKRMDPADLSRLMNEDED